MVATHGIENERLREIAPTFVGRTLDDVAKDNGLTPGSLRARFSTDKFKVKIKKGVIESVEIPPPRLIIEKQNTARKSKYKNSEIKFETDNIEKPIIAKTDTAKLVPISYRKPTRIALPDHEYEEMIIAFRQRNHRRCRS